MERVCSLFLVFLSKISYFFLVQSIFGENAWGNIPNALQKHILHQFPLETSIFIQTLRSHAHPNGSSCDELTGSSGKSQKEEPKKL